MRLHSIIFSSVKSTPFSAIEYEQKTSDYLESIGLNKHKTRTDELDVDQVFTEINTIYANLKDEQNELFELVKLAKDKQKQTVNTFLKSI